MKHEFHFDAVELDRLRQWYDALVDLSPKFLEPEDHELGLWITAECANPSVVTEITVRRAGSRPEVQGGR